MALSSLPPAAMSVPPPANTSPAAFSGAPLLPEQQMLVSPPARYTSAPAAMPSPPAAMVNFAPSSTLASPPRSERAYRPAPALTMLTSAFSTGTFAPDSPVSHSSTQMTP